MDGKEIISEMNDYLNEDVNVSAFDDDALPFETLDAYGTDPAGFGETARMMMVKVDYVFDLAVKYNRRSSQYLKLCAQLERGIKYLGSCCLTKHSLEIQDNGKVFPELGQLNTDKLYRMASVHFRKIDRALTEYIVEKKELHDGLYDMQLRYFILLNRLRSTEAKIKNFRDDYYFNGKKNYDPIISGKAFSEKSWSKDIHKYDEAAAFRNFSAFPMLPGFSSQVSGISGRQAEKSGSMTSPAPETGTPVSETESLTPETGSPAVETGDPASGTQNQTPEIPECIQIMDKVLERSAANENGRLTFTFDEMRILAEDPLFARFDPQLAEDIRNTLARMDTT